jgi:branched-subunit amino acid aminotransferase/4-amino-4-deoxychorismate lyase
MTTTLQTSHPAIMLDGRLVPADDPARVPLDDGLVRGDGVFEGMRLYGRAPRTPAEHQDRLARSAEAVGLPIDRAQLEDELAAFCRATSRPECGVRLIVTRGGRRLWREEPLPPPSSGLTVLPVEHRVTPLLVGAKTLSYAANMQAMRRARAAGCDDALFVRADDGVVLEHPVAAFAWLEGDDLVFPPLEVGVLDSITRRIAQQAVPGRERPATVSELAGARAAFVMSTVQEVQPVAEIAGVGRFDTADPVAAQVRETIRRAIAERVVPLD